MAVSTAQSRTLEDVVAARFEQSQAILDAISGGYSNGDFALSGEVIQGALWGVSELLQQGRSALTAFTDEAFPERVAARAKAASMVEASGNGGGQ